LDYQSIDTGGGVQADSKLGLSDLKSYETLSPNEHLLAIPLTPHANSSLQMQTELKRETDSCTCSY